MTDFVLLSPQCNGSHFIKGYLKAKGYETEVLTFYSDDRNWSNFLKNKNKVEKRLIKYLNKVDPISIGISQLHLPYSTMKKLKEELEKPLILGGPNTKERLIYRIAGDEFFDFGFDGLPVDLPNFLNLIKKGEEKNKEKLKEIRGLIYTYENMEKFNRPIWNKKFYLDTEPDVSLRCINYQSLKIENCEIKEVWVPYILGCHHGECIFCTIGKPYLSFRPKEVVSIYRKFEDNSDVSIVGLISQTIINIDKITEEFIRNTNVEMIRTMDRADDFLKNYERLSNALIEGEKKDILINHFCIGFESFIQEDLDRLKKGITVEQNLKAVNGLRELGKKHGNFIYRQPLGSHGLITFLPWRDIELFKKEFEILYKDKMWDLFDSGMLSNSLIVNVWDRSVNELAKCEKEGKIEIKGISESGEIMWEYKDERMNEIRSAINNAHNTLEKQLERINDYEEYLYRSLLGSEIIIEKTLEYLKN
jgi:hypothetical protein